MTIDHEELRSDCGLYVLGALRSAERTRFEEHLVTCTECRELVQSLSSVADMLPYAAPLVDPPAGLSARIVAAASRARAPRSAVPPSGTAERRTTRRLISTAGWIAAAASLLVAVALGARATGLEIRLRDTEQRLRDALTRITEYDRLLQTSRQETGTVRRMLALLTAADAVEFRLAGQTPARQASARAFLSRSGGVLFAATNLPAIPPDRTYQLWYLPRNGAPVSAGLIKPDAAGSATARFDGPVAADLAGMAVSLEPDGGVPAPTGAIYLATQ